jgi:penicillin-binding protein 1A
MAHSYETIAHGGERVTGSLAEGEAPVGIQEVDAGSQPLPDGSRRDVNHVRTRRILPASIASTETSMMETVLEYGTGKAAAIGQFAAGKTGTTSNYGDAWFVGWDSKYTVAVWVGYPNKLIPMTSDFDGGPVLGGTYPALIWHDFMTSALQIDKTRTEEAAAAKAKKEGKEGKTGTSSTTGTSESSAPSTTSATPAQAPGQQPAGAGKANGKPSTTGGGNAGNEPAGAPQGAATPERTPVVPPTPAPAQEAPATPAAPASSAPQAPSSSSPAPSSSSQTGGVGPGG